MNLQQRTRIARFSRFARAGAWLTFFFTFYGLSAHGQTAPLKDASNANASPLSISCTAGSLPSETGTANYFLVLTAHYANHGARPVAPILIKFTFYDQTGKVVASRTVIDSAGLQSQYTNNGRWQLIGYPAAAVKVVCAASTSATPAP